MTNHTFSLSDAAINWLAIGERGLSSEQMFETFTGMPCLTGLWRYRTHHPYDPSDLRRCMKLLETVPEFQGRMEEMRKVSPTWSRFVDRWDELIALLKQEMSDKRNKGKAPQTYELMKEIRRDTPC